jgi:hypothetical protein
MVGLGSKNFDGSSSYHLEHVWLFSFVTWRWPRLFALHFWNITKTTQHFVSLTEEKAGFNISNNKQHSEQPPFIKKKLDVSCEQLLFSPTGGVCLHVPYFRPLNMTSVKPTASFWSRAAKSQPL